MATEFDKGFEAIAGRPGLIGARDACRVEAEGESPFF